MLAAIQHFGETHPVEIPDTGSLRGDMIALLRGASNGRVPFVTVVSAAFSGLLASSGLTPAQVREKLLGDRQPRSADLYRRAHERGEIDLDRVPPVVLTMPFDLMRHDMLMTFQPISDERILQIVDDLFLPLVSA